MAATVKLEIWSDPICPWCYIGKAALDRALEGAPDHPFAIEWRPFQLNPDMPPEGMDRRAYLEAKFGGPRRAVEAYMPVVQAAEAAGLTFDLSAIARTPNTAEAHRLIHWAGLEGRQTPVVSALFRAYFREGRDIGDRATLIDLGTAAGMEAAILERLFASDADREAVAAAEAEGRARGIRAVPTFIVAGSYAVPGAQPAALWSQVIAELTGREPVA
jgi:predicted DsbA family dithiol-disulfide isomerase